MNKRDRLKRRAAMKAQEARFLAGLEKGTTKIRTASAQLDGRHPANQAAWDAVRPPGQRRDDSAVAR
jgi:hypothetical protein